MAVTSLSPAASRGAYVIVRAWASLCVSYLSDAALIAGTVNGLPGNFGRYATGNVSTSQPATTTISSAILGTTLYRYAVTSSALFALGFANIAITGGAQALGPALTMLAEVLRVSAADPADQIRVMTELATWSPTLPPSGTDALSSEILQAATVTASLCRRTALCSLARATAVYQPTSSNDATAVLNAVAPLIDAEALAAADAGDTATYLALRALRSAVANDLLTRGAALPSLITITTAVPMPSLALAYELYADATRADDLTARADPIAPLFMPTSFQALSS